jgi:hypothetical protein
MRSGTTEMDDVDGGDDSQDMNNEGDTAIHSPAASTVVSVLGASTGYTFRRTFVAAAGSAARGFSNAVRDTFGGTARRKQEQRSQSSTPLTPSHMTSYDGMFRRDSSLYPQQVVAGRGRNMWPCVDVWLNGRYQEEAGERRPCRAASGWACPLRGIDICQGFSGYAISDNPYRTHYSAHPIPHKPYPLPHTPYTLPHVRHPHAPYTSILYTAYPIFL